MINIATGNHIPTFSAAQGDLKWSASAVTFDESSALSSKTFGNTIIHCKSLTVSPPKGDVEMVNLTGEETVTVGANKPMSGTWQNAIMEEKPYGMAKISGTMILVADDTNIPDFLSLATGAGAAISTTYYRHGFGSSDSGETRVLVGAILLTLNNADTQCDVVLCNPFVNMGDIKPTGADGHYEVDFEASCLAKDFAIDIKK